MMRGIAVTLLAALTLMPFATRGEDAKVPLRVLALGDSYTIGESVEESGRWPVQLAALLSKENVATGSPAIIARTGWTTDNLWKAIEKSELTPPYDLVTLLIGVNNQFQGKSEDEYRKEFVALLLRSIELAGLRPGRVIVLSIPDYGATPFGSRRNPKEIGAAIDIFNAINAEESKRAGVRYADITPISRTAATVDGLIAEDGLHPSAKMYGEWAKAALPLALEALGVRKP